MPGYGDHLFVMRIGVLRRCIIALVILALAGAWHVVPAIAGQPCEMGGSVSSAAGHSPAKAPCNSADCVCGMVEICCQSAPSFVTSYGPTVAPVRWDRVVYAERRPPLAGRLLEPDLHPPTTRT